MADCPNDPKLIAALMSVGLADMKYVNTITSINRKTVKKRKAANAQQSQSRKANRRKR